MSEPRFKLITDQLGFTVVDTRDNMNVTNQVGIAMGIEWPVAPTYSSNKALIRDLVAYANEEMNIDITI